MKEMNGKYVGNRPVKLMKSEHELRALEPGVKKEKPVKVAQKTQFLSKSQMHVKIYMKFVCACACVWCICVVCITCVLCVCVLCRAQVVHVSAN
jgi:hypothetical protein